MKYANFKIEMDEMSEVPESFSIYATDLKGYINEVEKIKKNLALDEKNKPILRAMTRCLDDMDEEAKCLKDFSATLTSVIKLYNTTESRISVNEKYKGQTIKNSDSSMQASESEEKKDWEDKLKEALGLSDKDWEIFKTAFELIIGCIPVVNCVYDILDLVSTIREAKEDGEFTNMEKIAIILGVASIVGDLFEVGAVAKTVGKAAKTTKLAKTAAKTTKENAEKAAKTAAKKAAKTGGTQPGTKAAKRANEWKKNAESMKKAANKKEAAYQKAKQDAKESVKKKLNDQYKENVKDLSNPKEYAKEAYSSAVDKEIEKERETK